MLRDALAIGMTLALVACGGENGELDSGPDPEIDASTAPDAGGGGMDAGGDTDASADPDGGSVTPDAGEVDAALPPPTCAMGRIRIQEACPELAPCGGAVVGEWCYADVCITKNELLEEALMQPGVPPDCTANGIGILSSDGTIDGTIVFTDTTVTRMITSTATGTFYLPPECVIVHCRGTEAALNGALGTNGTAACMNSGTGCECDITFASTVDDSNTYTLSGSSIITGSGRRFDYCVAGGELRFREVADSGGEPGTQTTLPVGG